MPRSTLARRLGGVAALVLALSVPSGAAHAAGQGVAEAPRNVILLVGDGLGYNTVDLASAYQFGTTYRQVGADPATGLPTPAVGAASQVYEHFPVQLAMSTYSASGRAAYDPTAAWGDVRWVGTGATDSAAAATAMATGVRTLDGVLGLDLEGNEVENLTERADALGKATGVVTSVPFSHATPAGFAAHGTDRGEFTGIAHQYLEDDRLDVVLGAGHPEYDDSHQRLAAPSFEYVSEQDWQRLVDGRTGFTLLEERADFEALAAGTAVPDRVFGVAQVGSTLQQKRAGAEQAAAPFTVPPNDVPNLATMAEGALNVLARDDDGFFVMVEGGAIDWAGHARSTATSIEETTDFHRAVEAVTSWVGTHSSWDETLVVVTADHETGYLTGPTADETRTPLEPRGQGQVAGSMWGSGSHTNQLVPLYARGAGAEVLQARATGTDPVRGAYLHNTDLGRALLDDLWPRAGTAAQDVRVGAVTARYVPSWNPFAPGRVEATYEVRNGGAVPWAGRGVVEVDPWLGGPVRHEEAVRDVPPAGSLTVSTTVEEVWPWGRAVVRAGASASSGDQVADAATDVVGSTGAAVTVWAVPVSQLVLALLAAAAVAAARARRRRHDGGSDAGTRRRETVGAPS